MGLFRRKRVSIFDLENLRREIEKQLATAAKEQDKFSELFTKHKADPFNTTLFSELGVEGAHLFVSWHGMRNILNKYGEKLEQYNKQNK